MSKTKYLDLTKIYNKYKGKWVALDENLGEVLASGETASEVYEKAIKKRHEVPTLFRVPSNNMAYIGLSK